jgi:hypothetical protein
MQLDLSNVSETERERVAMKELAREVNERQLIW